MRKAAIKEEWRRIAKLAIDIWIDDSDIDKEEDYNLGMMNFNEQIVPCKR